MNLLLLLATGYVAVAGVRAVKRNDQDIIDVVSNDITKLVTSAKDVKSRTSQKLADLKSKADGSNETTEEGSSGESA